MGWRVYPAILSFATGSQRTRQLAGPHIKPTSATGEVHQMTSKMLFPFLIFLIGLRGVIAAVYVIKSEVHMGLELSGWLLHMAIYNFLLDNFCIRLLK